MSTVAAAQGAQGTRPTGSPPAGSRPPGRPVEIRRALALEWFSIAWMLAEGAISLAAGIAAGSLSLAAFGLDSLIEIVSASTVLWRLRVEAEDLEGYGRRGAPAGSGARVAAAERLAARVVAGCLGALALYILVDAIQTLRVHTAARPTAWGVAVAVAAAVVMPVLWRAKARVGRALDSEALCEDGVGNLACGGMALLVLAGLAAQRRGVWWADPAAALAIGALVAREGWEAWARARDGAGAPVRAFLGLGSNVGNRSRMLAEALEILAGPDLRLVRRSRVYETPPWGKTDQPPFLNQVVEVETTLRPGALLARCRYVEQTLGRIRTERWGPRTIDVDILLYGDLALRTPDLVVPHAEMRGRAFVLVPLAEIAPGLRLPTGETVAALLAQLPDRDAVRELA